jgi:GH43 family beta-xylosidase
MVLTASVAISTAVIADEPTKTTEQVGVLPADQFINPIGEGADPWVVRDPNAARYLWCVSHGNRAISIQASESLTSLGVRHIVWQAPDSGPYSQEVWAPELHFLDDRWHIYFAASDGDNVNHLAYVLKSKSPDPLGEYELFGPLATGEGADGNSPNIWAIDMTVLEHDGKRYAVWSGWDAPGTDRQFLYIAPMKSPTELAGPRVRICDNDDFSWERTESGEQGRGLNEGPQVFKSGGSTSLVFSCGASWLPTYKLGLLELVGDDPMQPSSWKKRAEPVFQSTTDTYGVGHSCFVQSPDETQWWHVFHAKRDRQPGWRRAIFVQPMETDERGLPQFGQPVRAGVPQSRPSGDLRKSEAKKRSHENGFSYYGHHQFYDFGATSIRLGRIPDKPINAYRSGEKVVFDAAAPRDLVTSVTIDFHGDVDARDAGILFRVSGASVGYDSQRGYFAGLIPKTGLMILGKTDGTSWTELARATTTIDTNRPQILTAQIIGDAITVSHDKGTSLTFRDSTFADGRVGLRVVDTDASFTPIEIQPIHN